MTEPIHIISLGAGVQSSTMALMAACGEITPMPAAAIFADTQAEPKSVYVWLDWLEKQLPFPVHRVTAGSLEQSELRVRRSAKSGQLYLGHKIPAFVKNPDGTMGLFGRRCTGDFKVIPLQKKVREIVGITRGGAKTILAKVWIGISRDEALRMKPSQVDYIQNVWPLVDKGITRNDCLGWMKKRNHPQPPRSACVFCPFHSDAEWKRLQLLEPLEFERAALFEEHLQSAAKQQQTMRGTPFLHSSGVNIRKIDFTKNDSKQMHLSLFGNECSGMCGV